MSKILIGFGLFFGAALVLVAQWLSGDLPQATVAVAGGFAVLLAAYLGLDLTAALNRSFSMPRGKIEKISIFKYVFSLVCLFVLALALIISFAVLKKVNDMALSIVVYALYFILATWIASRKLSKVAKNSGENDVQNPNYGQTQDDLAACGGGHSGGSDCGGLAGARKPQAAPHANCCTGATESAARSLGTGPDKTGQAQPGGYSKL